MKWVSKRALTISAVLFLLPFVCHPVRGTLSNHITTYAYGFPFSWFSVHFTAQGGRVFFWQAISGANQGFEIDVITAILNFIILYIVAQAIIVVFVRKKQRRSDDTRDKSKDSPAGKSS